MSHDLLTQLRTYAEQLDVEARPLESLTPASTAAPVIQSRRRWAVAVATAILVIAAIGVAVVTGLTGPGDDIIDEPTSVPVETTAPAPTTLPGSSTLPPATTLPATTLPPGPVAQVQPVLGYNVMGSAPFVFFDADGRPGAYYSSEWLYDSPNQLAKCADESCSTVEVEEFPLGPGSWLGRDQDGLAIRLQVEVDGTPIPRQAFGEFPASQVEGQPPAFVPATISVTGCLDPDCSSTFHSRVLEVTDPGQIDVSKPEAVPYPGGGKLFMSTAGNPVIVYSGVLDGADPVAGLAVISCGDVRCSAGNNTQVIHRSPPSALIVLESVAFGPSGDPIVAFVEIPAERSRGDGLLYPAEGGEWRGFVAVCGDATCSEAEKSAIDYGGLPLLAMGLDGNPVVAYGAGDDEQRGIYLQMCVDDLCTSATTLQMLDLAPNYAYNLMSPSLAIASDGSPFVTAVEWTGEQGRVHVAKCRDAACSSVQATAHLVSDVSPVTLQHVWSSAAAFDPAGIPVVAYYQGTLDATENLAFEVGFLRCADEGCSTLVP